MKQVIDASEFESNVDHRTRKGINDIINQLTGDELTMIELLASKMLFGKTKYGTWMANNDTRNYRQEAFEEILDGMNYIAMNLVKEMK